MNTYSKVHYPKTHCPKTQRIGQLGLVTVEFALIATAFFLVLFSIIGFANLLYIYNATVHATRLGARLAVVCDTTAATSIKTKMAAQVSGLTTSNINLTYNPSGCSSNGTTPCQSVTVSVSNFSVAVAGLSSFSLGNVTIPGFSTTLVRESMNSAINNMCR